MARVNRLIPIIIIIITTRDTNPLKRFGLSKCVEDIYAPVEQEKGM